MKQLASNNPNNRRLKKHSINNYVNNKNREYISMNKPGFNDGNINKKRVTIKNIIFSQNNQSYLQITIITTFLI